jgi:hypothetical protein
LRISVKEIHREQYIVAMFTSGSFPLIPPRLAPYTSGDQIHVHPSGQPRSTFCVVDRAGSNDIRGNGMKRIFNFFWRREAAVVPSFSLSSDQREELLSLLSELGLRIVRDARGPVPLLKFGRAVLDRLELTRPGRVPLPDFADALKRVIADMEHEQLRVLSPTEMIGVGYVFDLKDPETWPVRTSR